MNTGSLLAFAHMRTCRVLLWLPHLEELFARAPAPPNVLSEQRRRAGALRAAPTSRPALPGPRAGGVCLSLVMVCRHGVSPGPCAAVHSGPAVAENPSKGSGPLCQSCWQSTKVPEPRNPDLGPAATQNHNRKTKERQHFCAWDPHCVPLEGRGFASKKMDKLVSGWFLARGGEGGLLPVLGRGGVLQGGVREMAVLTVPAQRGVTVVGAAGPGLPAVCTWRCGWLCGSIY